jgi:hypothetical protein
MKDFLEMLAGLGLAVCIAAAAIIAFGLMVGYAMASTFSRSN